jgi:hypothetical protein
LAKLTRNDTPFVWSPWCETAFEFLKQAFTTASVLCHFDPDVAITIETDSSDYFSGGILSQHNPDRVLYPMAFFSKKHPLAECNYTIYDKDLLSILSTFKEWRPFYTQGKSPASTRKSGEES